MPGIVDHSATAAGLDKPGRIAIVSAAMKTSFSVLACAFWLVCGTGLPRAADPTAPAAGKVLVLDNERTMEGDVERVGAQYRVRRTVGETWVPGERVLRLCPDAPSAYNFLRERANLNDADERLRLAEWCRQHGLREQAVAEVREAVRLRPRHAPSVRLLAHLEQATPAPATAPKAADPEPEAAAAPVDLTADSLGQFTARVQPILMNTCAGCHAAGKGGAFKLTRCYDFEGHNRKSTQQNLAAVLSQVNLKEPQVSPLLTKAVSVHGSLSQAPLRGRQAPAYRMLEEWVKLTLAHNPQLHDTVTGAPAQPRGAAPPKADAAFASDGAHAGEASTSPATAPVRAGGPVDPFDPAVFNRQMHPDKEKAQDRPVPPMKP